MESFDEMLNNLYSNLELKNNSIKIEFAKPILEKSGKKTIWRNIKEYLKLFNREPDHFIDYINNETNSKVSWLTKSTSDGCIFENKVRSDYLYELMKTYIKEKVVCKNCNTINTNLNKIKELRKYKLCCIECKSEYFI